LFVRHLLGVFGVLLVKKDITYFRLSRKRKVTTCGNNIMGLFETLTGEKERAVSIAVMYRLVQLKIEVALVLSMSETYLDVLKGSTC